VIREGGCHSVCFVELAFCVFCGGAAACCAACVFCGRLEPGGLLFVTLWIVALLVFLSI
jgi:hypothetical protein